MIEKIVDILKEFLEKHFLPSLSSVVLTAIIFYFTPKNNSVLAKLGEKFYTFTIFCFSLLIIELLIKIYLKILNMRYYYKQKKESDKREELELENHLFEITHSLPIDCIKVLEFFLDNENKPLILNGAIMGNQVLNCYCESNDFQVEDSNVISLNPFTLKPDRKLKKGTYATRYRLRDEYYEGFMFIKKKYGKLTKF